ncbi:LacI family DNA-binding transcriptional regulator [Catellatospora coxensis]
MNKRPTIRDVAAMAGVSVATVSRVLSGDYPVANATRTKVQRAVRELDYVVNAHARALSGATSNVVALVMYDVVTPFFAFIASGWNTRPPSPTGSAWCAPRTATRTASWRSSN